MRGKGIRLLVGLLGLVLAGGVLTAQEKGKREADVAAVKKLVADFIVALEKGDAKAVSAYWTADGEFINEDGKVLEGRSAIEKAYTAHLTKKLPGKLETQIESIRFPSADTAILNLVLRRKAPWLLLPWGLHILMDIPTHERYLTPFLYPISLFTVEGYAWNRPPVLVVNVAGLLVAYAALYWRYWRRGRPPRAAH